MWNAKSDDECAAIWSAFAQSGRQAILAMAYWEGRRLAGRRILLRQGRKKFGSPSADHEAVLTAITNVDHLEALGEKLLDVDTWDDLLKAD